MSSIDELWALLTPERMESYTIAADGDRELAVELYVWNARLSSALFELIGLAEVAVRNAMDQQLTVMAAARNRPQPWYADGTLLSADDFRDIAKARSRATAYGRRVEIPGKVIAELNLGFWRFLASRRHHTSLWVPGLHRAFPHHPEAGPSFEAREAVFKRMEDVNLLRNRIAHHEPIHRRDPAQDEARIQELTEWISPEAAKLVERASRVQEIAGGRP